MTARLSRFFALHFLPPAQAIARNWMPVIIVGTCLLTTCGCPGKDKSRSPVLYKPSCDVGPVLRLSIPERIDTLAVVPRTETVFQNGTNKFGGRLPDEIKEMFYFRKGAAEYKFIVFYNEAAAIKEYGRDKERNVFREVTENGLTGRTHYTEEPRADPGGGSEPLGIYISRSDFRLHNVYIRVVTEDHAKAQNDRLANAVKDLAQMLNEALSAKQ